MSSRSRSYLGLAALSVGTMASLHRVFSGNEWVIPVFASLATALAVTVILDHLKSPGPLRTLLTALAAAWFMAIFIVPGATNFGLPNFARLIEVARFAFEDALSATTLLEPEPGFLLLGSLAAWAGVMVSEQVASGGHTILTALPWIGLFSLTSATGAPAGRNLSVLTFIFGLMVALYFIGPEQDDSRSPTAKPHRGAALSNGLGAGAIGGLAAASAIFVPQLAPGYSSPAWFADALQGPTNQTVVSPLVQIQPQLRETPPRKLFDVATTTQPGASVYWRLVALDTFDGEAWGTSAEYVRVTGRINYQDSEKFLGPTLELRQNYRIDQLGGPWLPTAYQAARATGNLSADPLSASLISRERVAPGMRYQITSKVPDPSPDDLREAAALGTELAPFIELSGVSEEVKQIAQTWTKDRATPYDKVVAISDKLRKFRYDENVRPGHSADHLLEFLTKTRAGYCEQFAASMAVLARSLGIPARVAVGFIPGDFNLEGSSFVVMSTDAHAWPEVYFSGVGWVPFEPTPRGGLAPSSYGAAGGTNEEIVPPEAGTSEEEPPPPSPPEVEPPPPPPVAQPPEESEPVKSSGLWLGALAILVVLISGIATIPLRKRFRARSRYERATKPEELVRAAYFDLEDRIIDLSRPRRRAQTPAEFLAERQDVHSLDHAPVAVLLGAFEKTAFAAQMPSETDARAAMVAATHLSSQLWDGSGWAGKLALLLSVRSLVAR